MVMMIDDDDDDDDENEEEEEEEEGVGDGWVVWVAGGIYPCPNLT